MHPQRPLRFVVAAFGLVLATLGLRAQDGIYIEIMNPWNPATPVPRFITANPVNLSQLTAFSLFRSGEGHDFADDYEAPGRSMKNYFNVLPALMNTFNTVAVYAPVSGTIAGIDPEQSQISPGVPRGYQMHINPTGYAAFDVRLFHINVDPGLTVGSTVAAGQLIGYAELRPNAPNFDWAVQVAWGAAPLPSALAARPPEFQVAPFDTLGAKLLNPFDLMDASTFAAWAPYGLTDINQTFFTAAYRDANPATFSGPSDPANYFALTSVPEPATCAALAGAAMFALVWTRRRSTPA